jgi:hypothetical protein
MFDKKVYSRTYSKTYRTNNPDKIKKREQDYRDRNKKLLCERASNYLKKIRAEKGDAYYKLLERKRIDSVKYRQENADSIKVWYKKNKDEVNRRRRLKNSLNENKEPKILTEEQRIKKNKCNCNYYKKKRLDGKFSDFDKFKQSVRRRTCYAFNRIKINKPYNTETLLGINMAELKAYLESLFKEDMSWDNRNLWHIDHIIPLASAKTKEDMIKLCHYTNLQPLWAKENMSKGAKIITIKTIENEY